MPATSGEPPAATLPDDAGAAVAVLAAEPRPAGGSAEARARAQCSGFLRARGFTVREVGFGYSAFPGRWATSAGGAASAALLALAARAGAAGSPGTALLVLAGGGAAVAAAGLWLARGGVLRFPAMRRDGVNLVAERGAVADERRVWLMAHLDSKSQPVPIGVRAAGVVGSVAAWGAALALAAVQLAGARMGEPSSSWWWVGAVGVAAAVPVALSVVGERSPGALDNATGVAAVLRTAAGLPVGTPLGVLLTSAEELGLAGSRAWAVGATPATALNFDGIDDAGGLTLMYSGQRPTTLLAAVQSAAGRIGVAVRARRLVPGILVDAVALSDAGWRTATLSRGTFGTLARIHRPADRAERLTGHGVAEAARVAVAVVEELYRPEEG